MKTYKLRKDGRLHGAVRCATCGVKASDRSARVRLCPWGGGPLCQRCFDDRPMVEPLR